MDYRSDQLGVMGTIYEEDSSSITAQLSPSSELTPSPQTRSFSSAEFTPSPKFSVAEARLLKRNRDTDVVIYVKDSCFKFHKSFTSFVVKSVCLFCKRQIDLTISPPLNITAETFSSVADFCYGKFVEMSPFNIAALHTAAELLEMTEINGPRDQNLAQLTEAYFREVVAVNSVYVPIVLRSSFLLLPEAETMSSLVSRCIEVLSLIGENVDLSWLDGVQELDFEHLVLVLESSSKQLTLSHGILYVIIDIHLKENGEKLSEEQKIRICNYIDCSILSPEFLMLAVQNPRMPFRFVVRAMHTEQLNTRLSIITSAHHQNHYKVDEPKSEVTLGAILERDAALRQVEQLKDIVTATNVRIQTLEKELSCMRWVCNEPGSVKGFSTSSRFSNEIDRKLNKGQIGSRSSLNFREQVWMGESENDESLERNVEKNFGRKLISGLKSVFGLSSKKKGESKGHGKTRTSRDY